MAAFTCAVPLGLADAVRGTDASGDAEGGAGSSADIVRATAGTDSRGRIVHTVSVAGGAPSPSGNVPLLHLELPNLANGSSECTVFVGVFRGRPGVYRCGTTERLGSLTIKRSGSTKLRYTFSRRALGNPDSYQWAVITRSATAANGSWIRYDRLPDGDDVYLSYSLR